MTMAMRAANGVRRKKTILTENGLADVLGGVNPSLTPSVMAARLAVASGKRASFQYDDAKAFIDTARDSGDYTTDGTHVDKKIVAYFTVTEMYSSYLITKSMSGKTRKQCASLTTFKRAYATFGTDHIDLRNSKGRTCH